MKDAAMIGLLKVVQPQECIVIKGVCTDCRRSTFNQFCAHRGFEVKL